MTPIEGATDELERIVERDARLEGTVEQADVDRRYLLVLLGEARGAIERWRDGALGEDASVLLDLTDEANALLSRLTGLSGLTHWYVLEPDSPEPGDAILDSLDEDDVMYDHPRAMTGEPMDPVLFVRWGAIQDRLSAGTAEDGLREARQAISRAHGSLHLGDYDDVDAALETARATLASTDRAARSSGELDAAWAEAEAALPEGWRMERLDLGVWGSWWAYAGRGPHRVHGEGDTPAAALRALAARLREPRQPDVSEEAEG